MKDFFEKNKIVIAVVVGVLIAGGAIYFSPSLIKKGEIDESQEGSCGNIPELSDGALKLATKVIDGDTFLVEGGYSVRILGIDADERGYPCYEEAKDRLEELVLNKEVKLEKGKEDLDQYCRYLRYVFLADENISLELVKEGLAVARFSPEDIKYREGIVEAEKTAKDDKAGCKWSGSAISVPLPVGDFEDLTAEKTSLEIVFACNAGNYYGKEMIVEGRVIDGFSSKTNTVFLNFEKAYPNQCFTAVIFNSEQYKFVQNPEDYYSNKTIRVKGEIENYQGKPEIILKDPSQIEVGD